MKILVTGSEGNIGRKLVPYLEKMGHEVEGFDVKTGEDILNEGFEHLYFNKNYGVVFHLAAIAGRKRSEEQKDSALLTNVYGIQKICDLCLKYNCKLIHFSTSEVYGNFVFYAKETEDELYPANWCGITKKMSEEVVQYYGKLGLKYTIVRPFMIYDEDEDFGDHRSAIIRFTKDILQGNKITVHNRSKRGWLHIDDAVVAFERLIGKNIDIINIGHPDVRDIQEIAEIIFELNGWDIFSCDGYELVDQPKGMILEKNPDLTRQEKLLNFKPKISIEEGLERVVKRVEERLCVHSQS
jgi:nucleoside-diphosphate-sugar epimerase